MIRFKKIPSGRNDDQGLKKSDFLEITPDHDKYQVAETIIIILFQLLIINYLYSHFDTQIHFAVCQSLHLDLLLLYLHCQKCQVGLDIE